MILALHLYYRGWSLIEIRGLGPAGVAAAVFLGREVVARDLSKRYLKACGEAVPVGTPLVEERYVLNRIKRFEFHHEDRFVGEVSYRKPFWYIVDKASWISSLRERIAVASSVDEKEERIVIEARGPYASRGLKITVARVYLRNPGRKIDPEAVYFIFRKGAPGFYWVFPHGEDLNVGGGFIGIKNPLPLIHSFIEAWLGGGKVIDIKGAPLTIEPEIDLGGDGVYRVGEAAGLVYPLTGEGIRPAILSSQALISSLKTKKPLESYRRSISRIVSQIEFQKKLLRIAIRAMEKGGSISDLANNTMLRDYVEENLSVKTLFIILSRKPLEALKILLSAL